MPVGVGEFSAQFLQVSYEGKTGPITRKEDAIAVIDVTPGCRLKNAAMTLPLPHGVEFPVLDHLPEKNATAEIAKNSDEKPL
jgi:hypothetical protein